MSDGLSDIAKDQRRGRLYYGYIGALIEWLSNPTKKNFQNVVNLAKSTDSVRGGYWGSGSTNYSQDIESRFRKLQAGDKEEWARILANVAKNESLAFNDLKALSPFADKLFIFVDYGCGFVTLRGEIQGLVDNVIREGKGWKTYDADDYAVILPKPSTENAKVFWLGCGISGVNGPRSKEEPSHDVDFDD